MHKFFTVCFLFLTCLLVSQNKLEKQKTDSILSIYAKKNQLDSLAIYSRKASINFYKKSDLDNAIYFGLKEIAVGESVTSKKIYKQALYNLARFYYLNDELNKSNTFFHKVINEFDIDAKTYQSYCDIGRNYSELYDFHQAVFYYKKGLEKPDLLRPFTLCGKYIGFADAYNNIETKESAKEELKLLKKADSLYSKYNLSGLFYELNNQHALYYNNDPSFNFNKSRKYYKKLLIRAEEEKNHYVKTNTYNNLGELYNRVKNDSAFYFLNKSITDTNAYPLLLPNLYSNLAMYYANKNEHKKALINLHKSLQQLTTIQIDSSYLNIPNIEDISLSNDKYLLLDNLIDKADNFLSLSSKNKQHAQFALKNLQLASQFLDVIKSENLEIKSKLFWQKKASELYMLGAKTAFLLNNHEQAFYFIEKNKAILLLEGVNENQLKERVNLPSNIQEKELVLKKTISNLENNLNEKFSDSLENKYNSSKIVYTNFIESLKKEYPEYYNYKTPVKIEALKKMQNKVSENEVVIEYILDDNEGFVLCLTNTNTYFFELKEVSTLQKEIESYLNLISKPIITKEAISSYNTKAKNLEQKLLPLLNKKELKTKNKLIIIPDYTLQNLPFESLKKDSHYLIEDFEILYAYSLSFLETNKNLNRNANNSFIGFAPQTFNYDNLQTLPRSKTETESISNKLNGLAVLDDLANKNNFFSKANNYKIIHLSTHANANDSIAPWIAFKDQKLYLNELYTTKNQAELVVLNACNSSLGQINAGEGVFSLARGFFYSGSNSVVSSLWNVNDKSNAEITTSFYSYLKDGKTKSAALRQAKLDYLSTHSLSEASPYYWSSLILIGDSSSIKLNNNLLYYIALGVLLSFLLFFISKKIKNRG